MVLFDTSPKSLFDCKPRRRGDGPTLRYIEDRYGGQTPEARGWSEGRLVSVDRAPIECASAPRNRGWSNLRFREHSLACPEATGIHHAWYPTLGRAANHLLNGYPARSGIAHNPLLVITGV